MEGYLHRRDEVLALYAPAEALASSLKDMEAAARLRESAAHLTRGKLIAVVCGEFKQGKSSLLNALLGEPGLFPVDVDITTNLVSSITSGPREKITILCGERGSESAEEIGRDRLADYVTEQRNPNNVRKARMLVIESLNPLLNGGLTLVDTPGVGGLNIRHTDITYAFLPNADVVLFVSDALRPLSVTDLKFVERLAQHCENILFVVTKIDRSGEYREIVESNRRKLAPLLNQAAEAVPVLAVSSLLKLAYVETHDPEDLADSHFAELEAALWALLEEKRGRILLARALVELGREVARLMAPVESALDACRPDAADLGGREKALRETRQRLQTLMQNDARWRTQLSDGLSEIRTGLVTRFQDGFAQLRRRAAGYLEDVALLQAPEKIAGLLEVDVNLLMTDLEKDLSRSAADLHAQLEAGTCLNLNPFEPAPLSAGAAAISDETRVRRSSTWTKSLAMVRNGMFYATAGAVIGQVIGGLIGSLFGGIGAVPGAALGAWLVGVAGGATGARQGIEQLRDKEKTDVGRILTWFLDDSQRSCLTALNDAVRRMERSMRDELLIRLRVEKQTGERALESLQGVMRLTREQAATRRLELEGPMRRLAELQARISGLAEAIALTAPQPAPAIAFAAAAATEAPSAARAEPPSTEKGGAPQRVDRGDWADV